MSSEYLDSVKKIDAAVQELLQYPQPNIQSFAAARGLPYRRLLRAYHGGDNRSTRVKATKRLTYDQEYALGLYCNAIDDIGYSITIGMVEADAQRLL